MLRKNLTTHFSKDCSGSYFEADVADTQGFLADGIKKAAPSVCKFKEVDIPCLLLTFHEDCQSNCMGLDAIGRRTAAPNGIASAWERETRLLFVLPIDGRQ